MTTSRSESVSERAPVVPAGACDCHIHVYGPRNAYPLAPTSPFDPPLATPADYREVMRKLGTERVVLVQAAGYGTDNRCMLDALASFGAAARGVATVTLNTSDAELGRMTNAGIRGARVLLFPGGVIAAEDILSLAERIKPFGWHVQLQLDGRDLPEHEAMLSALPVPLVIDHNGKFIDPVATDHPAFRVLLRLLSSGQMLGQGVGAVRDIEVRAARLCRCKRARSYLDRDCSDACRVGIELAARGGEGRETRHACPF